MSKHLSRVVHNLRSREAGQTSIEYVGVLVVVAVIVGLAVTAMTAAGPALTGHVARLMTAIMT